MCERLRCGSELTTHHELFDTFALRHRMTAGNTRSYWRQLDMRACRGGYSCIPLLGPRTRCVRADFQQEVAQLQQNAATRRFGYKVSLPACGIERRTSRVMHRVMVRGRPRCACLHVSSAMCQVFVPLHALVVRIGTHRAGVSDRQIQRPAARLRTTPTATGCCSCRGELHSGGPGERRC